MQINLKITKFFRIINFTLKKIIKALSIVYEMDNNCATDRGLHFLRNWFKNKVPHHPATHMCGLFYSKTHLKVLFDQTNYSLIPLIMNNYKNKIIFLKTSFRLFSQNRINIFN